ncbi:voltage-gated chloride channel/CBS domain protein [Burkholderia humptydooensis MSMB43]|uniref:Voltage-gated chloride channel/CBS domain protein n=1 Tax=Burkholderia humptydooensis MSMB43 TaxID=441157 RepID=A0ABN0G3I3_9BURK|nr:voltage-gated chloride channel/CBS domain protein [Burkholderia humptydooensis MSMB43]
MSIAAPHKRDFASNARLPRIALLALAIGVLSTFAAFALLSLIHLFTNLFFFQQFSFADRSPALNTLGPWAAAVPVAGGIAVGLIARFGSEKIRGHGIPEAIEAILFGKSGCRRRSRCSSRSRRASRSAAAGRSAPKARSS